jgi:hypothetical protein
MQKLGIAMFGIMVMFSGSASASTTTTVPTLHSAAGKLYKAGQICPSADLGKRTHSGTAILKCTLVGKYKRWEHS